jgi:hypothetical protein
VDANAGLAPAAAGNTVPSTLQNDVEVHTIDTSGWVIPDKSSKVSYWFIRELQNFKNQ